MNLTQEQRLTRLEDTEKIKVLITAFARAADADCDPNMLRPLFTNDAVFDVGQFGRLEGADDIVEQMNSNVELGFRSTLHFLVSPSVGIRDDLRSADCFYYLWETATHRNSSGQDVGYWIGGWYDALVVKGIDDKWRFRNLHLTVKLMSPKEEGWQPIPNSFDDLL